MRLLFACLLVAVSTSAFAADNWTGTWDTRWRDGGARLELRQDGDKVAGQYPSYNGSVDGQVAGRVFTGHWHRGDQSGGFDFVLAPDGKSFIGRYASGEWWTGARLSVDPNAKTLVDLSTPRAALQTFVRGGNSARYDAPDEMVKSVQAVDFGGASLQPDVKLGRTKALFDLIDATTFRLYNIPDKAAGDSLDLTLAQVDTDAKMPVRFTKHGDRWFIVMPDEATLAQLAKVMYARTGGIPPNPAEFKLRRTASDAFRTFTHAFYDWDDGGRADALATMDLTGIPQVIRDYQGALAAQYIAGVLNRVGLPEPQEIPDDAKSMTPYVLFSHPAGQIVIAPVGGTGKDATWQFTRETVQNARNLFIVIEDLPTADGWTLPLPHSSFFALRRFIRGIAPWLLTDLGSIEIWQIFGWAAVLLVSLTLGFLMTELLMRAVLRIVGTRDAHRDLRTFRYAVLGAIGFSIYKLLIPAIGLTDVAKQISVGTTGVLLVISLMWLGWLTIDALGERFFGNHVKSVTMDNIIVSLLFGLIKLGLIVAGLTLIAIELSLPYEGIIASLSIGGLAVAFASRETLSNVFGAGVLAIDRPFKRGDYISAGGVDGTVEHVGIRSTRVRTGDDSVIIMPNGKLADAMVNNLGTRRYHLKHAVVPLPYSTTASQIETLLAGVRKLVDAVPEAAHPQTSIAVSGMSKDGIDFDVKYALDVSRGGDEVAIANKLTLDILRLCEKLGVRASGAAQAAE